MERCSGWCSARAAVGDSTEGTVVTQAVCRCDGFAIVLFEINAEGAAADLAVIVHV